MRTTWDSRNVSITKEKARNTLYKIDRENRNKCKKYFRVYQKYKNINIKKSAKKAIYVKQ